MESPLKGQRAVVTGGGRGIGLAISRRLGAAGAHLHIVGSRSVEAAEAQLREEGISVTAHTCDLANEQAASQLASDISAEDPIDILVNNAGIIHREPAESHSTDAWTSVLSVNLEAAWTLSRLLGRAMIARGSGRIVNIASLLSFQGGINVASYAASKHAIVGLTKALSNEWAPLGVTVNCVAPGYIATDNTSALRADATREQQIRERIPAGRWGTPEDIAGAVTFLCGPDAAYITGHTLVVDGGWMAR